VFCTASGFLRQLLPLSFETAVLRLINASRSTKYTFPWSSSTTSVSPPPGGASGLSPTGLSLWNERPLSVERAMNEVWVVVPHGPDSQ
jgi:hypothetical protein